MFIDIKCIEVFKIRHTCAILYNSKGLVNNNNNNKKYDTD